MKTPWLTPDRDGGCGDWEGEDGEKFRHDKTIIHAKQVGADGENYPGVIRVMGNAKPEVWCGEVLSFIRTLKEKNILRNYNQIAVLSYSVKNTNVRNLAHCLEENGIPTFSPRSDMFFERREVRLVIGFFMFLFPSLVTDVLKPKEEYRTADDVYAYYEECEKFFGDEVRADREKHKGLILFASQKFKELSHLTRNTDYAFADLFYQTMQFPLFRELLDVRLDSGVQDLRPAYNLAKLSYTAFSRAQNLLVLSDTDTTRGERENGQRGCPSKYFDAVYKDLPDWEELFAGGNALPVLEEVKASDIKHEYSFTGHILLYEACPPAVQVLPGA